jgi:hypothetical protein
MRFKKSEKRSMHLVLATSVFAPFFSYALAHMRQAQALRGLLHIPSFFSSSFSRQPRLLKAPSMEIKQNTQLQINYF